MPWFQPGLSEVTKEYLKDMNYLGNGKEENKKESGKQGKCQLWRLMLHLYRHGWVSVGGREQWLAGMGSGNGQLLYCKSTN